MVTPKKGVFEGVPLNEQGRKVGLSWDPARDEAAGEQCRAYGAANFMRLPGRLHITWQDADTLRIDADAGTQTRLFRFAARASSAAKPTWQGESTARWERIAAPDKGGSLRVVTSNMRAGYLRKNGIPYSANATLTEYYVRLVDDDGQEYLAVTTMVDDPQYLAQPYIKTYEYKKQRDAAGWNPTACSAK